MKRIPLRWLPGETTEQHTQRLLDAGWSDEEVFNEIRWIEVNKRASRGGVPGATLLEAIETGNIPAIADLLESDRFLVDACNENGETPLHIAAVTGNAEVAELILRYPADPNAMIYYINEQTDSGINSTPLSYAMSRLAKFAPDDYFNSFPSRWPVPKTTAAELEDTIALLIKNGATK